MDISEKIKKALECRIRLTERLCDSLCSKCQFSVPELSYKEIYNVVLNYIQQLERENKDLLEERELNEHPRDKVKQLEAAHRTEYCEDADYDCKALGEARKRIAELEAQTLKWISVEERLPENDDDVLIITELGMSMGYYDVYRDYWYDYTNAESNIVTHWMPLPESPKEGRYEAD